MDDDQSDDESKNKLRIVEKTFLIPNARVGALIGKGGHRIKTLQKNCAASICIVDTDPSEHLYSKIHIGGLTKDVEETVSAINDSLAEMGISNIIKEKASTNILDVEL